MFEGAPLEPLHYKAGFIAKPPCFTAEIGLDLFHSRVAPLL